MDNCGRTVQAVSSGLLVNRLSSGFCRGWMPNSRRQMCSSVRSQSTDTGHGLQSKGCSNFHQFNGVRSILAEGNSFYFGNSKIEGQDHMINSL